MSANVGAAFAYRRTVADAASPQRLLVMLCQAARRNLALADDALASGHRDRAVPLAQKALDIVLELQATLNPHYAPELVEKLDGLYTFVGQRLLQAVTLGDHRALTEARRAFVPVAEAFEQAAQG